jgi:hypothetical protein
MRTPFALLVVLLAVLAALPAGAAASVDDVLLDCQDGRLDRRHSDSDLRGALKDMPTDLDEYYNCRELIRAAQQGVRGPGGAGPGSDFNDARGYGALPTGEGGLPLGPDARPIDPVGVASEDERAEIERARSTPPAPRPGAGDDGDEEEALMAAAGVDPKRTSGTGLPAALVVLLVLSGGAALAAVLPRLKALVVRRLG